MLEVNNICTNYGLTQVLKDVSLGVREGSVGVLLGRNGMGKTTTIHSIIGFTPPWSGTIIFKGKKITGLRSYQVAQLGLALVPQGRRVFRSLTVEENLSIVPPTGGKGRYWSLERVYSLFPRLKERAKAKAHLLSGGEQQMLSIGRALLANPDLLLMDEPSEGLAPAVVEEIYGIIRQLKGEGMSILLVEQSLYLAFTTGDYAYIIDKGVIVYESTMEELKANKEAQIKHLTVA